VLQIFGNWLYCRNASTTFAWPLWIDVYLFTCEYLVEELASDTIRRMLSELEYNHWTPTVHETERIYERTSADSPLRGLLVTCLSSSDSSEKPSVLQAAPDAFVRDFAVHVSTYTYSHLGDFTTRHGHPSLKVTLSGLLKLDSTISFQLQDTTHPIVLHSDVLCKKSSTECTDFDYGSNYQVLIVVILRG